MDLAHLTQELETLAAETASALAGAPDVAAVEALELDVLGKKGRLTGVLRGIGGAARRRPAEGRRDRQRASGRRSRPRSPSGARVLGSAELDARLRAETIDVTMPGRPIRRGSLHPSIESMAEIARIFGQFGFVTYETPEVETDAVQLPGRSTSRRTTRRATCGTRCTSTSRATCCARTPRPARST